MMEDLLVEVNRPHTIRFLLMGMALGNRIKGPKRGRQVEMVETEMTHRVGTSPRALVEVRSGFGRKRRAAINRALRRSRKEAGSRRYKEEEFKCPPLPEPGRYRAWTNAVQQNAAVASARPDNKAIEWVQQAFDKLVPVETLYVVPKRFGILSRKTSAKFQSIATGELGRNITQIVEEWLQRGEMTPTLVLLRAIVVYYDTGSAPGVVYNILDLLKITVRNGDLEGFINTWYMVLRGMKESVDPNILEHFFFNAV